MCCDLVIRLGFCVALMLLVMFMFLMLTIMLLPLLSAPMISVSFLRRFRPEKMPCLVHEGHVVSLKCLLLLCFFEYACCFIKVEFVLITYINFMCYLPQQMDF